MRIGPDHLFLQDNDKVGRRQTLPETMFRHKK